MASFLIQCNRPLPNFTDVPRFGRILKWGRCVFCVWSLSVRGFDPPPSVTHSPLCHLLQALHGTPELSFRRAPKTNVWRLESSRRACSARTCGVVSRLVLLFSSRLFCSLLLSCLMCCSRVCCLLLYTPARWFRSKTQDDCPKTFGTFVRTTCSAGKPFFFFFSLCSIFFQSLMQSDSNPFYLLLAAVRASINLLLSRPLFKQQQEQQQTASNANTGRHTAVGSRSACHAP